MLYIKVRLARELGEKYGLMGFHNGHGRVELVSGTTGEGLEDALFHVAELVQKKRQQSHKGFGNFVQPLLMNTSTSNNSLNTMQQQQQQQQGPNLMGDSPSASDRTKSSSVGKLMGWGRKK
jgi:hypothetical protein